LHTLKFIGEGANALIIGKPGTGKSHVAKAVAYQATLQGYDVRYLEADTEFARYALASTAERSRLLLKDWVERRTCSSWTICSWPGASASSAAEVLQAIVHQRYKLRRSHRGDLQPRGAGLGQIPGRRHHGQHHPGPAHAPLRHAGVRGQELPPQGGGDAHRDR
jgi:hypothetical protein